MLFMWGYSWLFRFMITLIIKNNEHIFRFFFFHPIFTGYCSEDHLPNIWTLQTLWLWIWVLLNHLTYSLLPSICNRRSLGGLVNALAASLSQTSTHSSPITLSKTLSDDEADPNMNGGQTITGWKRARVTTGNNIWLLAVSMLKF